MLDSVFGGVLQKLGIRPCRDSRGVLGTSNGDDIPFNEIVPKGFVVSPIGAL